jgi:hypothetical protein
VRVKLLFFVQLIKFDSKYCVPEFGTRHDFFKPFCQFAVFGMQARDQQEKRDEDQSHFYQESTSKQNNIPAFFA